MENIDRGASKFRFHIVRLIKIKMEIMQPSEGSRI